MRNKIKHILTVCFVIAAMAVVWNAPVWAGTATQAELTGTQEDIELNKEVTINWEKNGDEVDYYFTPTENKRYLFVLTDNDDRLPGLYQGDDKLSWFSYYSTVDGKMYLQTPVLEAGTKYDIYFTSREGETEIQFGFYDDIWHGAEEIDNSATGIMKKGYIDDGTNYSRCKIYKITVPEDGAYEYRVSGLNPTGIADDDYDFDVDIYDEDGNWNSNQDSVPNWGGSSDACAFANLEAGKTYYLRFSNYTLDSGVNYKIVINNLNIENAKNLGESAEGKLSASSDTTYKFVATEDKVYNFTDTKVSEDVKEFSIYDNDLNNISTNSIKKSKVTYNENNEPKVDYVTYKIYLKKGTYYINLNNTSDKETEYNIKVENEELVDIDSINLDSNYIEIEEGVKKAVKYTINPDNATFTSVDWKVSDTSIVSLGYVGNVMNIEALKEGECDITVTAKNGKKAVCHIVVKKAGDHKYDSTIEKASTSKDGKIIDKCSRCGDVKVAQIISHPTKVVLNNSNFVYDGKIKTPTVTVTSADGKTIDSANYDISYANGRKDAGTYDVKVTFKGNYTGSLTTKFTIAKANQSLKIKSPKKKMKVGAKAKIKIKANKGHGKVTYKVSNKKIAKIKKGKLVALKKGKVKLTVTLKATKNYNQKKVTITIKVK